MNNNRAKFSDFIALLGIYVMVSASASLFAVIIAAFVKVLEMFIF